MRWHQRPFRLVLAGLAIAALIAPTVTSAASTQTAADIVPDDCVFFSTSLKLDKQFEIVAQSRAVKRILGLPTVQLGLSQLRAQPQFQQFQQALRSPFGQRVVDTLKDSLSHEVFVYGGRQWLDVLGVLVEFQQQNMIATLGAVVTGREPNPVPVVVNTVLSHPDLQLPPTVLGFKVTDQERLNELLEILNNFVADANLPVRLEKTKVGTGSFHSLKLSVNMLPIPEDEIMEGLTGSGIGETQAERFYGWLKEQTLTISLGQWGDYLVLSFAADNQHLQRLGGDSALADLPALAPVAQHAGKPSLIEIVYVSKDLTSFNRMDPEGLVKGAETLLGFGKAFLPPGLGDRILSDVRRLGTDLEAALPAPSEYVQVTHLRRGIESFTYSRSIPPGVEFAKPMSIFQHAGDPVMAVATSAKSSAKSCDKCIGWLKTLYGYFTDFGLPLMDEHDRTRFREFEEIVLPFLSSLEATTRGKLVPAVDAGQSMFVLDTKLNIERLIQPGDLPKPMPMLELAIACTLNDGDLFVEAMADYLKAIEDFIPKLEVVIQDTIPVRQIPRPETSQVGKDGVMYFYSLPPILDPGILPHAVVGKKLLILSTSPAQSKRMFPAGENLPSDLVPLGKPAGAAGMCRPPLFWNWLKQWIEFVLQNPDGPFDDMPAETRELVQTHVDVIIDVLNTVKGISGRSYREKDYVVTHTWCEIKDLSE